MGSPQARLTNRFMGLYDREYYRDESAPRHEARGPWSITTWLIVINAGVFTLNLLIPPKDVVAHFLSAHSDTLSRPYLWWQLITYGFVHDPEQINHIVFNMFGLFCFGRVIESTYGSREYLRFYLTSIFLGGLFWTARTWMMSGAGQPTTWMHLMGASGGVVAVTLLFCINYPKQTILLMMVLPVPAWFVGAMIIIGDFLHGLLGADGVAVDVHLVGAAFAMLYYKQGIQLSRWIPSFSIPKKLFSRKPRLRVHHATDDESDVDDSFDRQADQLLEKINREGIDSLTAHERRTLEQHSRRMRDRRR
jgi:membrane associated rhomboid family serine protease